MNKLKFSKNIKMVITDFDGVVTDNNVFIDENRNMSRRLNFRDVMGFSLLKKNGIKTAIISGEKNSAIELIAEKFQIEDVFQDIRIKIEVLNKIIEKYDLKDDEYLFAGDDVNDIQCLENCKYKVTVPSAHEKVKKLEGIQITQNSGGEGAFREIVDSVLENIFE